MPVQTHYRKGVRAVFVLELYASDVHAALGRLLDQTRVAGLRLAAVNARAEAGEYRIEASIDVSDREVVDRLARRVSSIIGVAAVEVRDECQRALPAARVAVSRVAKTGQRR
jgi:acetolactate synthase regulatory subunit